jgi:hypothetical protein
MTLTPAQIAAASARLRIDGWSAEVVGAMRERDIRAVLLKGPAIGRWLYREDPGQRPYSDVDLIVSPADTGPARALLGELGFVALPYPPMDTHALHALPYERARDRANVDLHRTLHGLQDAPADHVWQVVSSGTEIMRIGNLDVEIPGVPIRILHLVLHLSHSHGPTTQPWRDLERGLSQSAPEEWRAAVAIARELGVEHEMAIRLRLLPRGAELADELGLTNRGSRYYRLRAAFETERAPPSVHSIWALKALPDTRSRLGYVRAKLRPDPEALRERSTLARRGHTRLAGALHVARVLAELPVTLVAWLRYYRE